MARAGVLKAAAAALRLRGVAVFLAGVPAGVVSALAAAPAAFSSILRLNLWRMRRQRSKAPVRGGAVG
jgi:hypothetical protein